VKLERWVVNGHDSYSLPAVQLSASTSNSLKTVSQWAERISKTATYQADMSLASSDLAPSATPRTVRKWRTMKRKRVEVTIQWRGVADFSIAEASRIISHAFPDVRIRHVKLTDSQGEKGRADETSQPFFVLRIDCLPATRRVVTSSLGGSVYLPMQLLTSAIVDARRTQRPPDKVYGADDPESPNYLAPGSRMKSRDS